MSIQTDEIKAPKPKTKQAKLVGLLSRKSGVTIEKASEALEWQSHTTRASLVGLKKRGYVIERDVHEGKPSTYHIRMGD